MPPSTRRGIGTDDGLEVSTSGAACGSPLPVPPFPPEPPFAPFPDPELPSPGVGSFPPGARWPSRADCSARVMTSSASEYGPMSGGIASIASS